MNYYGKQPGNRYEKQPGNWSENQTEYKSDRQGRFLNIIAIGFVTFFSTFSSDMIYPLLPLFLSSVLGVGAFGIGLVEGIADATSSALKIASGYFTDKIKRRKPFVSAGYGLSSLTRPLIGMAGTLHSVLWLRFMDRAGSGIRASPMDALVADFTDHEFSGHAFGFQKAMDHGGSVMGPLAAVCLLKKFGLSLRQVFLFSAFPAAASMTILIFLVKERKPKLTAQGGPSGIQSDQKIAGRDFMLFLLAGVIFTLGHPPDLFLLLRLNVVGVSAAQSAVLWALFNLVKVVSTYVGGSVSDGIGPKPIIMAGWVYCAIIYLMFAHLQDKDTLTGAFLLYGVYFGLTEPTTRSWIALFIPQRLSGRAFGYYNGATGIMSLPASLLFGLLWQKWGYQYAFFTGVAFALLGCIVISVTKGVPPKYKDSEK